MTTLRARLADMNSRRQDRMAAQTMERWSLLLRDQYAPVWRRVTEYLGLSHTVATPTGPTVVTPRLCNVDVWGPNIVLIVRLLPGQLLEDLRAQSERLAPELGASFLRFTPRGDRWVRIELMETDPLDVEVITPEAAPATAEQDMRFPGENAEEDHDDAATTPLGQVVYPPVLLARTEAGADVVQDWDAAPNCVIQGATRSGKSVFCYSLLAQLARRRDVLIAGSDPSGILLGRPYVGTVHRAWQVTGSGNVAEHLQLLRRLVAEMDRRITELPDRADKLPASVENPLMVVVLEEFAGLLRLASTLPTPKGEAKITDQLRALFGRLVSEGHKVGFRLVVITQRADATIIGGFERGQLGLRVSFRVTDPEALVMLHPEGRDYFRQHTQAPPGVALFEAPGTQLTRVRGPRLAGDELSDYARYWDEIQSSAARLHLAAA
jgi:S-DNA-T family DNA segregation ATPase FtsK/SpoIIIE